MYFTTPVATHLKITSQRCDAHIFCISSLTCYFLSRALNHLIPEDPNPFPFLSLSDNSSVSIMLTLNTGFITI